MILLYIYNNAYLKNIFIFNTYFMITYIIKKYPSFF